MKNLNNNDLADRLDVAAKTFAQLLSDFGKIDVEAGPYPFVCLLEEASARVRQSSNGAAILPKGVDGKMKQRTLSQNSALHVYFELLANELNAAGLDMKKVFEIKAVEVPWNASRIKETLWRPIQEAMTGEESTTKLSATEVSEVYETLNRHTADKLGVSVGWPSYFNGGK